MNNLTNVVQNAPWSNLKFYQEYLAQAYYYTSHSTKLLAAAAGNCNQNQESYYKRCIEHIKEEHGHDLIALSDLKVTHDTLENHPELSSTKAFWEPQYYKVQKNPYSLLGYIFSLEYKVVVSSKEVYAKIKAAHGDKCCNFLKVHIEDDPDHVKKAYDQIMSLNEIDQKLIWQNYEQTTDMFGIFLLEIEKVSSKVKTKVAS